MLNIARIDSLSELAALKKAYFAKSTAPLDGMWHFGFVPMATHFGFYLKKELVGFCCINDDGYLLQFHLEANNETSAEALFTLITQQTSQIIGEVKGAFVSTAEPAYLSLCLDNSSIFKVNALMFQQEGALSTKYLEPITMASVNQKQLNELVQFSMTNIGAPEVWLTGYYSNLVKRKELFGYWCDGELLAAGECRLFDEYQTGYADLGVIVAQSVRGQGIATQVLSYLKNHASSLGLQSMCSTENSNISAQKAIVNAGFVSANRIVQFEFKSV